MFLIHPTLKAISDAIGHIGLKDRRTLPKLKADDTVNFPVVMVTPLCVPPCRAEIVFLTVSNPLHQTVLHACLCE
jgi:hypothetical protein